MTVSPRHRPEHETDVIAMSDDVGRDRKGRAGIMSTIRPTIIQAVKYGGVGLINTAVTVTIMVTLERVGLGYLAYTAIGYLAGFLTSYVINGLFTFRVGRLTLKGFPQFLMLNLAILLGVEILEYLLIDRLGVVEVLGVALGMVTYTAVGFVLNRMLIFREAAH
jgi:putative flippase GtrA